MKFIVAYQIIQDCYIEIEAPNHIEAERKFKNYPKLAEGPITMVGIYPAYNRAGIFPVINGLWVFLTLQISQIKK